MLQLLLLVISPLSKRLESKIEEVIEEDRVDFGKIKVH